MDYKKIQESVNDLFTEAFSNSSLNVRLNDIEGECRELRNFSNLSNLKEEAGDLLASVIQLCNESGFDVKELLAENNAKIRNRMAQYKSLGRKTRVCILPIAGNPITKAHVMAAELILKVAKMDEVHISLDNNHLEKKLESPEHRLNMAHLAISENPRIKISDYQIKNNLAGEAFNYINVITHDKEWENHRFFYAVGQDRANELLETWYNADELIKLGVGFVIIPRIGYNRDVNVTWYLQKPHIIISDNDNSIPNISSTMARELLKNKEFDSEKLKGILDEKIIDYIIKNDLYQ